VYIQYKIIQLTVTNSNLITLYISLTFSQLQVLLPPIISMDQLRLGVMSLEINGVPEELRCKRSDGKQWRCSALSMPDKTVCEKHYIQAKKRAANSALRASLKKARRMAQEEEDIGAQINGSSGAGLNIGSISPARRFGDKFSWMGYVANGVVNRERKEAGSKLVFSNNGVDGNDNITNGDGREFVGNGIGPRPVVSYCYFVKVSFCFIVYNYILFSLTFYWAFYVGNDLYGLQLQKENNKKISCPVDAYRVLLLPHCMQIVEQ
jgi:WRC